MEENHNWFNNLIFIFNNPFKRGKILNVNIKEEYNSRSLKNTFKDALKSSKKYRKNGGDDPIIKIVPPLPKEI